MHCGGHLSSTVPHIISVLNNETFNEKAETKQKNNNNNNKSNEGALCAVCAWELTMCLPVYRAEPSEDVCTGTSLAVGGGPSCQHPEAGIQLRLRL